jgi:hypothetical protein
MTKQESIPDESAFMDKNHTFRYEIKFKPAKN